MHPIELQEKFEATWKQLSQVENIDPDGLFPEFIFPHSTQTIPHRMSWFDLIDEDSDSIALDELNAETRAYYLAQDPSKFSWVFYYFSEDQYTAEDPFSLDAACCDGTEVFLNHDAGVIELLIEKLEQSLVDPPLDSEEKEQQRRERYYDSIREDAEWRETTFLQGKPQKYHVLRILYKEQLTNQDTGHLIQKIVQDAKGGGNVSGAEMWGAYWSEYAKYDVTDAQHQEILMHIRDLATVQSILEIYPEQ